MYLKYLNLFSENVLGGILSLVVAFWGLISWASFPMSYLDIVLNKKLSWITILSVKTLSVKNFVAFCRQNYLPGYLKTYFETFFLQDVFFIFNDTSESTLHHLPWVYLNPYQLLSQFIQDCLFPPHLLFKEPATYCLLRHHSFRKSWWRFVLGWKLFHFIL